MVYRIIGRALIGSAWPEQRAWQAQVRGGADGKWHADATLAGESSSKAGIESRNTAGKSLEACTSRLPVWGCLRQRVEFTHPAATCWRERASASYVGDALSHGRGHLAATDRGACLAEKAGNQEKRYHEDNCLRSSGASH
ncbi:hypothetical protein IEQ34_013156 [Dendrobium chrysotoxum]|uniref:Uncharacterized protein n=1 Tax=Dendrobium chrysotoxum TaxID=161865 RepID=A0AAV7GMR3_DENCH|nr:hypothetical protein IEQ34_013156 [Dendrobium chrysotoxum]